MTNSRAVCRSGERCDPKSQEEALYCQVHHSQLSVDDLALALEVNASNLRNWTNSDYAGKSFPSKRIERLLTLTADNPTLTTYWCQLQGRVSVLAGSRLKEMGERMRSFAEMLCAAATQEAAGTLPPREAARIAEESQLAMGAIAELVDTTIATGRARNVPVPVPVFNGGSREH